MKGGNRRKLNNNRDFNIPPTLIMDRTTRQSKTKRLEQKL